MEPLQILTDKRHGDSIALIYDDGHIPQLLTYKETLSYAGQICELLRTETAGETGHIVAVSGPVSPYLPCALVGILKSRGAFWYISPEDWSKPSLCRTLLQQEGVNTLLLDSELLKNAWIAEDFTIFDSSAVLRQMGLVMLKSKLQNKGPDLGTTEFAPAYVITTSGTTGQPKVVRVPYRCIWPNISDLTNRFKISAEDRIYLTSPLTFDPSVVDMFLALSNGAALVMTPESVKLDTDRILAVLQHQGVSVIQATPTFLRRFYADQLRASILGDVTKLRLLIMGGEACPTWAEIKTWRAENNRTDFWNIYGVTEMSCWASIHKITPFDDSVVSIGTPLSETGFTVKDKRGREITDGEGLLYLTSDTRQCMIRQSGPVVISNEVCTGDLVRIEQNAGSNEKRLFYVGRLDRQVKRQGKRINLESLENLLRSFPSVDDIVVVTVSPRLVAFVQSTSNDGSDLRALVNSHLPKFSEIDEIVAIQQIPMTSHGKTDHDKLIQLYKSKTVKLTDLDEIWLNHLSLPVSLDVNASLLQLGGDSLSAVLLAEKLESAFDLNMPNLVDLILTKSYGDLKTLIIENSSGKDPEISSSIGKRKKENGGSEISLDSKRSKMDEIFHADEFVSISRCSRTKKHGQNNSESGKKVMCLDSPKLKKDRELNLVWQHDTGKCVDASPLIVVEGEKSYVYIGSHSHRFVALSASDGHVIWETTLGDRVESSACVTSCGRYVVVGCYDHNVYFLSLDTGHVVWKFETGGLVKSSPCVDDVTGDVIIGSHDNHLYSLSLERRQESWKLNIDDSSVFASPCVIPKPHQIYAATLAGTMAAVNPESGKILWSSNVGKPLFSSPSAGTDTVVIGCVDHCIYAYNHHGQKLYGYKTDGPVFSSPSVFEYPMSDDDNVTRDVTSVVYCGSHDGQICCLENGKTKWRTTLDGLVYASPFVCTNQGLVVIASTKSLYILDQSGVLLHRVEMPGEVFSSPVVHENRVIVGCRDNNVYCYEMK